MNHGMLGGEDVSAVVFEYGHTSMRCGFAGEIDPLIQLCSSVGISSAAGGASTGGESGNTSTRNEPSNGNRDNILGKSESSQNGKIFVCATPISNIPVKEDMEVVCMLDEQNHIQKWDAFEAIVSHAYKSYLKSDPRTSPALFAEPPNMPKPHRERLTELMFEQFHVPAFWLAKTPVLVCFAHGKSSGIVLDCGAGGIYCHPVQDGFALPHCAASSIMGGNWINDQCRDLINKHCPNIGSVVPPYMVASKELVLPGMPANYRRKPVNVTESYHAAMVDAVVEDFKRACVRVSEVPLQQANLDTLPASSYDFPHGYSHDFAVEMYDIGEMLFDPAKLQQLGASTASADEEMTDLTSQSTSGGAATTSANAAPTPSQSQQQQQQLATQRRLTIPDLIAQVVSKLDVDIRTPIGSNLIVAGGQSCVEGFVDRLKFEVDRKKSLSNLKMKILSSTIVTERARAAWIGGSILASLGTFQTHWISAQEYQEHGSALVHRKCP